MTASAFASATPLPADPSLSRPISRGDVLAGVSAPPWPYQGILTAPLKKAMAGTSDVFIVGGREFVQDGHHYLLVATASPSVRSGGSGYCGAGIEHRLLLVEWQPGLQTLHLRDTLEVQSCLKNFELASDEGDGFRQLLQSVADPTSLKLTWLNHPTYGNTPRSIFIKNKKFQIE